MTVTVAMTMAATAMVTAEVMVDEVRGAYLCFISSFFLCRFWFAGRFIGLAIIKNHLIDVFFARHIYKILLGR